MSGLRKKERIDYCDDDEIPPLVRKWVIWYDGKIDREVGLPKTTIKVNCNYYYYEDSSFDPDSYKAKFFKDENDLLPTFRLLQSIMPDKKLHYAQILMDATEF